jgi:hypothetical protein
VILLPTPALEEILKTQNASRETAGRFFIFEMKLFLNSYQQNEASRR